MSGALSLTARVAITTAASAAAAALVAAIAASMIAERLVVDAEDRRLRATGAMVLGELHRGGDREALVRDVGEEVAELAPASIRIAVTDHGGFVGGDQALPVLADGACTSQSSAGATLRACATARGSIVVVACATRASSSRGLFLVGCAAATVIAALLAGLASRRAARWAIAPLTHLRAEVDAIRLDAPSPDVISNADDCAEIEALRSALVALVGRLAEALDRARRFSSEAAHEIKTPLTAISAELDLLAEEPLDAAPRAAVDRLRYRAATLARLVERLLALATARERVAFAAVDLEDVAREVVARAGAGRATVQADASGTVRGDETLLTALVENAVDNALKFSSESDGAVVVRVSEDEARVVLDVTDEGPGISDEDRAHAFEPFYRAATSRAAGMSGHGIGLALVAQIAEVHGGTAEFVERSGGAHLRVTLPVWSPEPT